MTDVGPTTAAPPTLGALQRAGTRRLAAVSDTPALDCSVLLATATGLARTGVLARPERVPSAAALRRFETLIAARAAGRPLAHLTGRREFWSLTLAVTPAVLVPRPETELLVATVLARMPATARVLDLGTGSGAVAVAVASERPQAQVTGVDLSGEALAVAAGNVRRHRVAVRLVASDWGAAFAAGRFDCVVSNPPYVEHRRLADDPALRHEPALALDGGEDGLAAYRRLLPDARRLLRRGGWVAVEHGNRQGEAVRALLAGSHWQDVETLCDLAGHPRVTVARAR